MAIRLFERVERGRDLFAVETISLIYHALTTLLIGLLYARMDHPGVMLLERLGIVGLTFTLIFLYQAFHKEEFLLVFLLPCLGIFLVLLRNLLLLLIHFFLHLILQHL